MRYFRFTLVLLPFVLLFACQPDHPFETETQSLQHDGYERSWDLFVPTDYDASQSYPLIIAMHGGGGTKEQFDRGTRYRMTELAGEEGFLVAFPQGIGDSWNDSQRDTLAEARRLQIDDVGFIREMIDQLSSQYSIDSDKVFACGISNGGFMSVTLGMNLPARIKAVGVVAAGISAAHLEENPNPLPFPAIFIHGTEDPLTPYDSGYVEVLGTKRGLLIGMDSSISYMRHLNDASFESLREEMPDLNQHDDSQAEKIIYENPSDPDLKVGFIRIEGGGHTWPGGTQYLPKKTVGTVCKDFNACDELWNFFKQF